MVPTALHIAALQQLALAASFFALGIAAHVYGDSAQGAAEDSIANQGVLIDSETLQRSGLKFTESISEMLLPLGIGSALVVVAALNLTGATYARGITWVVELLLLVVVGFVTYQQVFVTRIVKRAWGKAHDERLRRIDVEALMNAASAAYPSWLRPLQVMRFLLATLCSLAVMAALLLLQT